MAAYTITDGTLKRKNEKHPRFNRPGPNSSIRTNVCCEISNGVETQDIEFIVDIFRTDSTEEIDTKLAAASIVELAKYNV